MGLLMLGISELACGSVRTGGFDSARGDADKRKRPAQGGSRIELRSIRARGLLMLRISELACGSVRTWVLESARGDGDKRKRPAQGGPFSFIGVP